MSSGFQTLPPSNRVRIVVASSVALTFISFWRAAAIVLNDLGSSAYYVGGIAEDAFGRSAPWFILGVMLFSFAVRAVYVESCSMFVRGGVYRVVKEALGGTLAKLSVSALMFDYILTGPISGVSAGQYIAGLINELLNKADAHGWIGPGFHAIFHGTPQLNVNWSAVVICLAVTLYYWWENLKGIEESSDKALRVMQITTVMVVLLLGWSIITLLKVGGSVPPWPIPSNLHFSETSLGFLKNTSLAHTFGLFGILMAFGHSVLAMSGEETLAQVNREIAHPKLKNLKRAAIIVAIYSFLFTGVGTLLAVMLIPQNVPITNYENNLLAELVMWFNGPLLLRLLFRTFVVVVGFLILSGAINTSIIGSNGVLNRVSEDGVLSDWFRKPQKRYGTSYRIVNLIVGLQVITILLSRGDVNVLGEAYAFGVIWSFTFNSLAMLVLRLKYRGERGWKVPPNLRIAGREIPLGLLSVFMVLLTTAAVNLLTKRIATISGIIFAAAFFLIFTISERTNARKFKHAEKEMKEHFQLLHEEHIERDTVGVRPDCTLVTVRDANTLLQLRWVLQNTDTTENDVVVLAARLTGPGSGEVDLSTEQIFSEHEQTLFTKCVSIAESYGKHISLMVVPARDVFSAIVQTANSLGAARVVAGLSTKMTSEEQAFRMGQAWEGAPTPKHQFVFQVVKPGPEVQTFRIGPHTPDLATEDVMLVHRLWLDARRQPGMEDLHHHDILTLALTRLASDYSRDRQTILKELRRSDGLPAKTPPRVGPTGTPLPKPLPTPPPTEPRRG
jgi:amino acid transporter